MTHKRFLVQVNDDGKIRLVLAFLSRSVDCCKVDQQFLRAVGWPRNLNINDIGQMSAIESCQTFARLPSPKKYRGFAEQLEISPCNRIWSKLKPSAAFRMSSERDPTNSYSRQLQKGRFRRYMSCNLVLHVHRATPKNLSSRK